MFSIGDAGQHELVHGTIVVGYKYAGQRGSIDQSQYFGCLVGKSIEQLNIPLILQAARVDQFLAHLSNVVHDFPLPDCGSSTGPAHFIDQVGYINKTLLPVSSHD